MPGMDRLRSESIFINRHDDHDFAVSMLTLNLSRIGCGSVRERHLSVDKDAQLARIQQAPDFRELLLVRLNDKERIFYARISRRFAACGNRYEAAARFQHIPRALQRLAAHAIKYNVHIADNPSEGLGRVVDDLPGSQPGDEFHRFRRSGRKHLRSEKPRQLDSKNSNRACRAVYKKPLARLQFCAIDKSLPGGKGINRNGSGFRMREAGRFARDARRQGDAIVGSGSVGIPVIHPKDFFTHREALDSITKLCNDAGKLMTRNSASTQAAVLLMRCWIPEKFCMRYPCRIYLDEN